MDGYFILQSSTLQVVVEKCTYRKLWIKRTALQLVISTNKPSAQKVFLLIMPWKTCWLFLLCLHIIMWFYYDWSGRLTLSFLGILNDQMLNPTLFVWFPQVRPWFCITIEDNKGNPFSYADMKITGAGEDVTLTFRDLSTILTPHCCSTPEAWKRTFTQLKIW